MLLAVFTFALPHVYAADPICYGQQGVQNDKMFSCQPSAPESACCAPGDICYSNGLCAPGPTESQNVDTPFFWNGCTDPSACFSACFNRKPFVQRGTVLSPDKQNSSRKWGPSLPKCRAQSLLLLPIQWM
jgi:hypothetical protein